MEFGESVLTAIAALVANKLRALLTMLGVIIGVAAVITMIAIGEGAERSVMERIQSLGSNLLFVNPGAQRGGGNVVIQFGTSQRLTRHDADAIQRQVQGAEAVVPEFGRSAQVKYENRNWNTRIIGTVPEYESARNFPTVEGRYFTHAEERAAAKVCVLGSTVAENLVEGVDPLEKTLRISGQSFTVIGVLESKGQGGWQNPDDQIIVPLSTAQRRIFGVDFLSAITVKVIDDRMMESAFLDIERVMRRQHRLREGQDNDFSIRNQADILSTFQETQQTFTFLLAGIAGVSLLVGGIGIMNIMIVSVTERTREIGIRKAVGARKRDILWQFLIESVALSVSGGLIGIALGIAAARLLSVYGNLESVISPQAVIVSFVFASLVGIFFGLYPARRAAQANVVDALRYE